MLVVQDESPLGQSGCEELRNLESSKAHQTCRASARQWYFHNLAYHAYVCLYLYVRSPLLAEDVRTALI